MVILSYVLLIVCIVAIGILMISLISQLKQEVNSQASNTKEEQNKLHLDLTQETIDLLADQSVYFSKEGALENKPSGRYHLQQIEYYSSTGNITHRWVWTTEEESYHVELLKVIKGLDNRIKSLESLQEQLTQDSKK